MTRRRRSGGPTGSGTGSKGLASPAPDRPRDAGSPQRLLALGIVAAAIVFFAAIRIRLADTPLERDEGEYAYAGQLILHGVPPYQQAYNMKFPGTYYSYAAIMALFGETPSGIRYGLLIVNALTALVVFGIGRRLLGDAAGAAAALFFLVLSVDRWILGTFAHATHFVLLPAMGGLYLLMLALDSPRPWLLASSGALLGAAVLMKQHAVLFGPLALLVIVMHQRRGAAGHTAGDGAGGPQVSTEGMRRAAGSRSSLRIAWLLAGAAVPFGLICLLFLWQGVLGSFWFWTFQYAREYVSEVPASMALHQLSVGLGEITTLNLMLWLLAGGGLIALWTGKASAETRLFLTGLLVCSFLATVPGFYFREHYFIVMLPAIALLAAFALAALFRVIAARAGRHAAGIVAGALCAVLVLAPTVRDRAYLFSWSPRDLSRMRYGSNPFIEALDIAKYLRDHTTPDDVIAVLGSEPEIYFYADRRSASGYIYTYALLEPQKFAATMRQEMIRQIEAAHPKYIVFAQINASWLPRPGSDLSIIDWGNRYTQACYDIVGMADIYSYDRTNLFWEGGMPATYTPKSDSLMYVFRRKSDAPCTAPPPAASR
jgi:hypothetical protein